jgi:hypothetical protein
VSSLYYHDNDQITISGSCFPFGKDIHLWDFKPISPPPKSTTFVNITLQIVYTEASPRSPLYRTPIQIFNWSINDVNRTIDWLPHASGAGTMDNLTLFKNESYSVDDISTFRLHFRTVLGMMGAPWLDIDRMVLIADYSITGPLE